MERYNMFLVKVFHWDRWGREKEITFDYIEAMKARAERERKYRESKTYNFLSRFLGRLLLIGGYYEKSK